MSRGLLCALCLFLHLVMVRQSNASTSDDSQQQTALLKGTVTDSSGATIPGASIEARNTHSREVTHATTDPAGRYSVTASAAGVYRETIVASGFKTVVIEGLRLSAGTVTFRDVMLQVGATTDSIYVKSASEVAGGQVTTEGRVGIFGDVPVQLTPFSVQSYTAKIGRASCRERV